MKLQSFELINGLDTYWFFFHGQNEDQDRFSTEIQDLMNLINNRLSFIYDYGICPSILVCVTTMNYKLLHVNTSFPADGAAWGPLCIADLWEEVCHRGSNFKLKIIAPFPVSSFFFQLSVQVGSSHLPVLAATSATCFYVSSQRRTLSLLEL